MKVFVAAYDHKYGVDLFAFATQASVIAHRASIARKHWKRVFEEECPDLSDEELSEEYFDRMGNTCGGMYESYSYEEVDVLGENEAQDKYVKSQGNHCPHCGSSNIEGFIGGDYAGDEMRNSVACNSCGATWTDVYTLTGFEDLEVKS